MLNARCYCKMIHIKCRGGFYPSSSVARLLVPDDKVPWSVDWDDYLPPNYSSSRIHNQSWADPDISNTSFQPKWNTLDGTVNRQSHEGQYQLQNGYPLNPHGRTGIQGRGLLGRWGPNHAADPIVTRWKKDSHGVNLLHHATNFPILQFVAIQRRDSKEWAIPGGMVDPGEVVTKTLQREFLEEALNSLEMPVDKKDSLQQQINAFFACGVEVFRGYVDDPRNTDNAWMETVAMNFHEENGKFLERINLKAGDDAMNVRWMDIGKELNLYASHNNLLQKVSELHKAHWDVNLSKC